MERMGDKAQREAVMRGAGVPVVPGSDGVDAPDEARGRPTELGYPVLLKAAAGGGGMRHAARRGRRTSSRTRSRRASAEAQAAFGDGDALRRAADRAARHVEVQVLVRRPRRRAHARERECSIQRRHQKLIEESPSPALDAELREEMEAAAERACRAIGYSNAGTFEFLIGPDGAFYFIELNARLQVEHPVTELVTGVDLVREQLAIAAGERLAARRPAPARGHAIEFRINAEDPARFAPAPGTIERFRPPLGPGRPRRHVVEDGTRDPPYYDSLIAKLIVWDADRAAAIARARARSASSWSRASRRRGTSPGHPRERGLRSGDYSTSFVDEAGARLPALAGSS